MRMIGTIGDGEEAERFSDYLLTRDIENMIEQTSSGDFGVWVEHDDHLDRAKGELDAFLKQPDDPQYRRVTAKADKIRKQEEKKSRRLRRQFTDVRTSWARGKQWAAPLTITLLALSVLISVAGNSIQLFHRRPTRFIGYLMFAPMNDADLNRFADAHPDVDRRITFAFAFWVDTMRRGQVWRLISDIFVHWSVLHLLFDMIWLVDLGAMIERRLGAWRLLALVLVTAIISNFAEYLWSFPAAAGGMSGVVYGLFGYIWIKQRIQPHLNLGVSQETVWLMLGWLVLCMTPLLPNIANAAHVGGLITGVVIAYTPYLFRRLKRR